VALPVYSFQFISIAGLAGTATAGPAAGYVAVIRDIDIYYVTGLAGADCQVQRLGGPVFAFFSFGPTDPSAVKSWHGRQVLFDTDELIVTTTGALDVSVSGYVLTAP
jgi:hypothetical protein